MNLNRVFLKIGVLVVLSGHFFCSEKDPNHKDKLSLSGWERGIRLESRLDTTKYAYFWFYEWHLFDAVKKGEHTSGRSDWPWQIDSDQDSAWMRSDALTLQVAAKEDGADLFLEITNTTSHDWPEIAALIPCFNPGSDRGNTDAHPNPLFKDTLHTNTWFINEDSLALIKGNVFPREIHFNSKFLQPLRDWKKEGSQDQYIFSHKWPVSTRHTAAGLMIRESDDHSWVMGIAWEDFISVQGHNPWNCMHLSVRVGGLPRGASKKVRGKIYLFKGSKEDCLSRYKEDFKYDDL